MATRDTSDIRPGGIPEPSRTRKRLEKGIWTDWNSEESSIRNTQHVRSADSIRERTVVSPLRQPFAYSAERVDKWACGVLLASAGNRTKQPVYGYQPEYWTYDCTVIYCEWFLTFLWVFCCNYWLFCFTCTYNKRYFLNPQSSMLQHYVSVRADNFQ